MQIQTFTLLAALLALLPARAQINIPEKKLESRITEATIFLNGAQVLRTGNVALGAGTTEIILEKLPVGLDPGSIQVKGDGDFTIMAVTPSRFVPPRVEFVVDQKKVDALLARQKDLQQRLRLVQFAKEAYDEEERLLDESRAKLTSYQEGGLSVEDVDKAADLYRRRFASIKQAQWENAQRQLRIQTSIDSITTAVNELRTPVPLEKVQEKPSYQIAVTVSARRPVSRAVFEVSYLVPAAGWLPSYDVRIQSVDQPVDLGFRAQVYQGTGEDWRNVKLTLSTGNPSRNSVKPSLTPWYLDYHKRNQPVSQATGPFNPNVRSVTGRIVDAQTNEPLPGATIIVQGTTIGTTTDFEGNYQIVIPPGSRALEFAYVGYQKQVLAISATRMDVRMQGAVEMLEEVVITGGLDQDKSLKREQTQLGNTLPLAVNRVERATNQVFEIETPYSLAGNGRRFAVDVLQYRLPAEYAYASVPKMDANAYLTARIPDWDTFDLLEGEARLFFEDAYLGKTLFDTRTVMDTLVLSLGIDDAVVIERDKVKDESKSQLLGLTRKETRVFEIVIRNTKNQTIRCRIEDQVPLSRDKEINIKFEEAEGAEYNKDTGQLLWDISLAPGKTKRLRFSYVVKYPAAQSLYLE